MQLFANPVHPLASTSLCSLVAVPFQRYANLYLYLHSSNYCAADVGYVPSTGQCTACSATQYIGSNGQCTTCPTSCGTTPCQINSLVTGGVATQSSTHSSQYAAHVPRIVGNIGGFSHTIGSGQANAWWQLQLTATERVSSVTVALRLGACKWSGYSHYDGPVFGRGTLASRYT